MASRFAAYPLAAAGILLFAAACQSGTDPTASAPPPAATPAAVPSAEVPAAVWDADVSGTRQSLLGLNTLTIDLNSMSAAVEPLRLAQAIGDSYDVDIYEYLRKNPCGDCLQVTGLGYALNGALQVELSARHPFQFGPNRYDLHVFDVRGTLISLGQSATNSAILSNMAGADTPVTGDFGLLENAEGWSSFFTEQVKPYLGLISPAPTGTIFPFKTFFRDLGPTNYDPNSGTFTDLQNPAGHNTMKMGSQFSAGAVTYSIKVPDQSGGQLRFLFLLDAAYGQSAIRTTRLNPKYYLPEFHRKDPFEVTLELSGDTLVANRAIDIAQLTVTARDWQGELPGNPGFSPDSGASTIKHKSGVASITAFVPGVMSGGPQTRLRGTDFTGDIGPGDYWTTYQTSFNFTNSALAPAGTYYAVVAVRDDLYGSNNVFAVTREFVNGLAPQSLTDITTYAVVPVEVVALPVDCPGPNGPVSNPSVTVTPPSDGTFNQGKSWSFQVTGIALAPLSQATALSQLQMDLDWDGNPFNFSANLSTPLSGAGPTSGTINTDFTLLTPLSSPALGHQVGFRITDNFGNCNYRSATLDLWPPVTCPGPRGPSFNFAALNAPQPQGNSTNFQASNLIRGGQTAITALELTFPGYPSVPMTNVPVPGGPEPLTANFSYTFSDPGFGVFAAQTNVTCALRAVDAEGNCNTQTIVVPVDVGAPAPTFDLIPNPSPATVLHGTTILFLVDNIATPSSSVQSVEADPRWNGLPASFTNEPLIVFSGSGSTRNTSFDYRQIWSLPNGGTQNYTFAVRITNTAGKSTIMSVPVSLIANVAPTVNISGPANFTVGVPYVLTVNGADVNGNLNLTDYYVDWGDGFIQNGVGGPFSRTYTTSTPKTIRVRARDTGYGPTNGPAPLPAKAESTEATLNITALCSSCPSNPANTIWCEEFECATDLGLPTGWVGVAAQGDTQARWGVKNNASLRSGSPVGGSGTKILEESGILGSSSVDTVPNGNGNIHANRWGVFSPPIFIPNDALNYRLEVIHRYFHSWAGGTSVGNTPMDGHRFFIKHAAGATDPGATESGGAGVMVAPTFLSGGYNATFQSPVNGSFCTNVIDATANYWSLSPAMPGTFQQFCLLGSTSQSGWITSVIDLNPYKNRTVRVYTAYGQAYWNASGAFCFPSAGWNIDGWYGVKIDRMRVFTQ